MRKQAIFLMGPTAAGKTTLAIQIARQLPDPSNAILDRPIDIISVDSAMIYRGMDIGTGKPSPAELQQAPHALIDILDPSESYSAALFCHDAYACMEKSIAAGRIPMLVGGTMMYFNALMQGLSDLPQADPQIRARLLAEAKQNGWQYMHNKLQQLDPATAARIHPNDPQRIQRALEVIEITGQPFSQQMQQLQKQPHQIHPANIKQSATAGTKLPAATTSSNPLDGWQICKIALAPKSKQQLHDIIAARFHHMLDLGLIDEVATLYNRGDLHIGLPSIRSVGYRQVWQYLAGQHSREEMIDKAIVATRQLAKRQYTWLRRWPDLQWLDSTSLQVNELILHLINLIKVCWIK